MSFTGLHAFDRSVHTANVWLKDLQRSLGWDERDHAYAAFRAVIRALRDRLPREEAVQLAAQLPMLLAGVFLQGWRLGSTPVRMDEEEFLERVRSELEESVPGADPRWAVEGVIDLLSRHVSPGEVSDVLSVLPPGLRELWTSPFPGAGPDRSPEGGGVAAAPDQLDDWNVVATCRPDGLEESVRALSEIAEVGRTGYVNVLVARTREPDRFLEELRELADRHSDLLGRHLSRAVPLRETFDFESPEEFEPAARRAAVDLADRLAGKSFHVRVHRHGLKGKISSPEEERHLGDALLEELERRGTPGSVTFDDPDAVVVVETVSSRAGVSLFTRQELARYPFLGLGDG